MADTPSKGHVSIAGNDLPRSHPSISSSVSNLRTRGWFKTLGKKKWSLLEMLTLLCFSFSYSREMYVDTRSFIPIGLHSYMTVRWLSLRWIVRRSKSSESGYVLSLFHCSLIFRDGTCHGFLSTNSLQQIHGGSWMFRVVSFYVYINLFV